MRKKKDSELSKLSDADLQARLARLQREWGRRKVESGAVRTMTDMELAVEEEFGAGGQRSLETMIASLKPESGKPVACPLCGKRASVRDTARPRTVRTLRGEVTLHRNYHYCVHCKEGFYPVDRLLGLPSEGTLTETMQARVLDFAVNDTFEQAASRWAMHYGEKLSENLFRRVTERVGKMCERSDRKSLHRAALTTRQEPDDILVIQTDGSMLPIRGEEPWKEVKMAVLYRARENAAAKRESRYVAVLGKQEEFRSELRAALAVENAKRAMRKVWIADGARENWNLAYDTCLDATQVLDWYHAIQNATDCADVLFEGNRDCVLLWKKQVERILLSDSPESVLEELRACRELADNAEQRQALDKLLSYYFSNRERMQYAKFRAEGFPIGSGVVESAHRHVLQVRMKRAGQHWDYENARRMVQLRALYRTTGPHAFHRAILTAANDNEPRLTAAA